MIQTLKDFGGDKVLYFEYLLSHSLSQDTCCVDVEHVQRLRSVLLAERGGVYGGDVGRIAEDGVEFVGAGCGVESVRLLCASGGVGGGRIADVEGPRRVDEGVSGAGGELSGVGASSDAGGGGVGDGGDGEGVGVTEGVGARVVDPVVSARTAANRAKRVRAKERKARKQAVQGRGVRGEREKVPEWRRGAGSDNVGKRGFFAESTPDMRHALRMSRGERLIAENDLKAFQARRRLELEKDKDVNALKKLNEAQLLRRTETNKVQIEKAYASLAASGNVPGVGGSVAGGGSVETIVSGSSGSYLTISPGSSVSMKEVHEMQKENLRLKKREGELVAKLKTFGVDEKLTEPCGSEKTSWTIDQYGDLHEKYKNDPTVPEGLVIDIDCRRRPDPDGKVEERVAKYYEEMSDQVSEIVMY